MLLQKISSNTFINTRCGYNTVSYSYKNTLGTHLGAVNLVNNCPLPSSLRFSYFETTDNILLDPVPKVYTMSVCGDSLIVGTAGRRVIVWDLRNMGYVQQRRESNLKYQTRCIRSFPNKQGYVLSSIEGKFDIFTVICTI